MSDQTGSTSDDPALRRSLERWLVAGLVVGVVLVGAFPAYRVVEASRRDVALAERDAALITLGRDLWTQNCASCHGDQGQGVDAPALNAKQFHTQATDDQIHHVIQAGIPGTEMAAWWRQFGGPLTDEQIRAIVAYIRSWEDTAPDRPDWRNPTSTTQPQTTTTAEPSATTSTTEPGPSEVTITVDDVTCGPLEIEVTAGAPFTLRFQNQGRASRSLDVEGLGQHIHAPPGEIATVSVTPLSPGNYSFECLGTGHGQVLGVGRIHAS